MASKSMTLVVRPRGKLSKSSKVQVSRSLTLWTTGKPIKKLPEESNVISSASTSELYQRVAAQSGLSIHRLKITKGSDGSAVPNSKTVSIVHTGLRDHSVIYVKDLGPQIAWRTVFVIEYLGPLIFHPLFYYLRPLIYGTTTAPSYLQTLSFAMITLHFFKRELETLFVHRFSMATMPARNIFINSGHYWITAGINLAYWVYAPTAPTAGPSYDPVTYLAIGLYILGELGNLYTHLVLRDLRKPGTTQRGIPTGFGFGLVTCPNYLFEAIAWVGVLLVTRSLATIIFIVSAVFMMMRWGRKKEMRYRKEFGDRYKKKRYSVIPGIY
ncbi:MAG: 3-oxo-5a-steroid 4- dehydrogenase [Thelocarpon superellum]|nr:MAG: 3-oxo-5a-steroid 4- dehydrogenase [Thelocarpon superellum]